MSRDAQTVRGQKLSLHDATLPLVTLSVLRRPYLNQRNAAAPRTDRASLLAAVMKYTEKRESAKFWTITPLRFPFRRIASLRLSINCPKVSFHGRKMSAILSAPTFPLKAVNGSDAILRS